MRKILAIAALLLAGACQAASVATTTFDPVPAQKSVYALKAGYAAALTVAVAYNQRPRCGQPTSPMLCSDAGVVAKMRQADAAASTAIDAAERAVRSLSPNPTVIGAAIQSADDALTAFKTVVAIYSGK